jgi:LytS/YehU family sensor histidine kinase
LIALAIVAPIAAECFAWAAYFAEAAVDPAVSAQSFTWSGAIRSVSFWTWVFLAWSGLYLALTYSFDVRDQQREAARLQEEVHTAQLQALHSQINPHFLFNSLNSVSALILDGKPELAESMVTKLAQFLRLNLAADPRPKIPLASEIAVQKSYLDIERVRYPDLDVDIDVPERLASALVPSLILQPIIENAVKYGVAGAPPPASLRIAASQCDDKLRLEVIDAGKGGCASAGAGIGLRNITRRLELLYGADRVSLTAGAVNGAGFKVEVIIPLERM